MVDRNMQELFLSQRNVSDQYYIDLINLFTKNEEEIKEYFSNDNGIDHHYIINNKKNDYLEKIIKPYYEKYVNKLSLNEKWALLSSNNFSLQYLYLLDELNFDLLDIIFEKKVLFKVAADEILNQNSTIVVVNNNKFKINEHASIFDSRKYKNSSKLDKRLGELSLNCNLFTIESLNVIYDYFFTTIEEDDLNVLLKNNYFIDFIAKTFKKADKENIIIGCIEKYNIFSIQIINQLNDREIFIEKALRYDSKFILKIESPTIEQYKIAIEVDYINIASVKNQSIEMQKFAINVNNFAYIYINNRTQEIKDYYMNNLNKESIEFIKSIIEKSSVGKFNANIECDMNICKKCKFKRQPNNLYHSHCLYSFNNGLFDGCPYFLEHLIKE